MPDKLMIFRFSALGDVAMTYPVLKVFTEKYPGHEITFVSRPFFKPVFETIPGIKFYPVELNTNYKGLTGLYKLFKQLKANENPDKVLDLHDVLRTKIIRNLFKIKGFPVYCIDKGRKERKQLVSMPLEKCKPLKSVHERYADVFRKAGFQLDLSAFKPTLPPLNRQTTLFLKMFQNQKLVGIAPLAKHIGKQYPLGGMREVLKILTGRTENTVFFLFGAPSEKKILDSLITNPDRVFNLAGLFNFSEELQIISRLHLMLSMDSGNGHLAANFGVPVITVWGITHPYAGFAPFGQKPEQQILPDVKKFPMLPCSIYGNKICKGYEKIWDDVLPEQIGEAVLKQL